MIINSTELQNNFGKYLMLAAQEEIIITRNGTEIAKLTAFKDTPAENPINTVQEKAPEYSYGGKKASYEEFLQIHQETEERMEYIDGEIYWLASPKTAHQIVITELFGFFFNFFQGTKCRPMVAPYDIELRRSPENINIVQPDIMIICDLEEKLNENDYYKGVPSLVVEVLSKGTRRKDMIQKLDLYMSCGVNEYWIVNPDNKELTVYLFEDHEIGNYVTYKNNEAAKSYIFEGLSVEISRIFKI
ncbi:type II toxin-antitoxin system Phd/YefM family antitoxin [Fredinandcohnia quinoae]|uniref:Type II toxin-antitoxin system Phd/YefM family antitoxin n=1 Tax=Fredinandcohnia quinoae TaxID=2918902 RepID=A0AAW5DW02_9BACI|nr:type II toxin-antitoxin system Phd/YefM family antitoxin [Fredinandcohnia sp. SECRCQ15]MCH1624193.1 type II toxin-antitoxin system Phd/YefM family antitoxin [Fredinandcohnia sp. SECRCQ15]